MILPFLCKYIRHLRVLSKKGMGVRGDLDWKDNKRQEEQRLIVDAMKNYLADRRGFIMEMTPQDLIRVLDPIPVDMAR